MRKLLFVLTLAFPFLAVFYTRALFSVAGMAWSQIAAGFTVFLSLFVTAFLLALFPYWVNDVLSTLEKKE